MALIYAKNIRWGELSDSNTVEAVFDVYESGQKTGELAITSGIREIQQAIIAAVKGLAIPEPGDITDEEAVGLYAEITQNTELFFE